MKSITLLNIYLILFLSLFSCKNTEVKKSSITGIYKGEVYLQQWENIDIQIFEGDSIVFVKSTIDNSFYGESYGKVKPINDSLFYIQFENGFNAGHMKNPFDSLYIYSNFKSPTFKLTQKNGKEIFNQKNVSRVKLPFNIQNKNNLILDIQHQNPVTKKPVLFNIHPKGAFKIVNEKYENESGYFAIIKNNKFQVLQNSWQIEQLPINN